MEPTPPPPPYDVRIEYLESSGAQYIDTGVAPTLNTEIRCTVIVFANNVEVLCTDKTNSKGISISHWNSGSWAAYFGDRGYIPGDRVARFVYNRPTSLIINKDALQIDEETYDIAATSMNGDNMYLFYDSWGRYVSRTRIVELSIIENGTPIRDFIPVRVGQTGYMYDRVSGQLFGNAGTGEFILGPDV